MNILVTGGAGYIGSNIVLELLKKKHNVVIIDNLTNSSYKRINILKKLSKNLFLFYKADCRHFKKISYIFSKHKFECVIHLAGLKSIQDSIKFPKKYYYANVLSTKNVLKAMKIFKVKKIIFSSSASVYGEPRYLPIDEEHRAKPLNPYAKTKLISEKLIKKFCKINKSNIGVCLRYFNPLGSDYSNLLSDNFGYSKNLYPSFLRSIKKKKNFIIYGNNFKTKDGTAVRDFIHISDLVNAHVSLLDYHKKNFDIFNIGTGKGYTVLEVVNAFCKINKIKIKLVFKKKREGEIPIYFAKVTKIKKTIGWHTVKNLNKMCLI
jgi:UDP-glucose 4-epimerase